MSGTAPLIPTNQSVQSFYFPVETGYQAHRKATYSGTQKHCRHTASGTIPYYNFQHFRQPAPGKHKRFKDIICQITSQNNSNRNRAVLDRIPDRKDPPLHSGGNLTVQNRILGRLYKRNRQTGTDRSRRPPEYILASCHQQITEQE